MKLELRDRKYILDLRTERPERPNYNYVQELYKKYDKKVCEKTITNFFRSKREFIFEGSFCVPNKVPINKFTNKNMIRIYEYQHTIHFLIEFIIRFNFCDEKHIVNHDCLPKKVRRDPVTGKRPAIMVSGNFCNAYNIFACISANPKKITPIAYHIERNNGSAVSFVTFICNMI